MNVLVFFKCRILIKHYRIYNVQAISSSFCQNSVSPLVSNPLQFLVIFYHCSGNVVLADFFPLFLLISLRLLLFIYIISSPIFQIYFATAPHDHGFRGEIAYFWVIIMHVLGEEYCFALKTYDGHKL